jgi:hypothetical protein
MVGTMVDSKKDVFGKKKTIPENTTHVQDSTET